jgi:hypothetical protein
MKRPDLDEVIRQKEKEALDAVTELVQRKESGRSKAGDTQVLKAITEECETVIEETTRIAPVKSKSKGDTQKVAG